MVLLPPPKILRLPSWNFWHILYLTPIAFHSCILMKQRWDIGWSDETGHKWSIRTSVPCTNVCFIFIIWEQYVTNTGWQILVLLSKLTQTYCRQALTLRIRMLSNEYCRALSFLYSCFESWFMWDQLIFESGIFSCTYILEFRCVNDFFLKNLGCGGCAEKKRRKSVVDERPSVTFWTFC